MLPQILDLLNSNSFLKILLIAITLDTVLGVLRAVKYGKFNSAFGIDGAIRKVAMLISIIALMAVDVIVHFNLLFMVPEEYIKVLGITKLGMSEFFCLLFILYETVSILKNMTLLEIPVPARIRVFIEKFLHDMTDEMDNLPGKERKDEQISNI